MQLVPGTSPDPAIKDYIPARKTIAAAQKAGLSVGAYIDRTFAQPGATPQTVQAMLKLADLGDKCGTVCEIGAGSGRDEAFRQLVLARIIEPVSEQDSLRVLQEAGVDAVSYPTLNRRLPVYATQAWRQQLSAACAVHAALGPVVHPRHP